MPAGAANLVRMRSTSIVLPALMCLFGTLIGASSSPAPDGFHWIDHDGRIVWSVAIDSRVADRSAESVLARPWFPPLESLDFVRIDGGEPLSTEGLSGAVVILDFWTSWCGPCRDELPRMQAFHERNSERGLITLAINVREHPQMALAAADDFGLKLPIVEYSKPLEKAFDVSKIPTVVVVDRLGRVRARWESFPEGVEEKIYETVETMLDAADASREPIAEQVSGRFRFDVRWMREFPAPVHAVQTITGGPAPRVAAAIGRNLHVMDADAATHHVVQSGFSSGRLAASKIDDKGGYRVLAYRLGGTNLSRFDLPEQTREDWESPAPILDALWVDPDDPSAGVIVGTMEGLVQMDAEGAFGETNGAGLVRGIARSSDDAFRWIALTGQGDERHWRAFSEDLTEVDSRALDVDPWRLEGRSASGHTGLFSARIRSAVVGRFFSGVEHEQVAIASERSLVVLDTRTGDELFRATWDGIGTLAAGDLDGNGRDELVVAWGFRLAVLAEPD